jgi:competence protein ComEC
MTGRRKRRETAWRPSRLVVAALLALALSLTVAVAGISAAPDGRIHITVLDVGQGDAILIEGDRGARMLIDGGPDPDRLLLELDARIPPWDRRIDVLVLSHPHEDHAGGLPRLIQGYRIGRVFEPGMIGPGPAYHAFRAGLALQARTPELLSTGDRLRLDSIELRVLWPDRDAVPREPPDGGTSINNVSIVLLGTFGSQRFLLTGDIEQEIDPILLSRGLPRIDLLKVAHHGSRTSSTAPFLDAVRPKVAIVSVGAVNPYGHPAPETLARITARGARLYRTDRNGSVEATLDGRTLAIQAERGGPAPLALADGRGQIWPASQPGGSGPSIVSALFRCSIVPIHFGPAGASPPLPTGEPAAMPPIPEGGLYHRLDVHPIPGGGRGAPPVGPAVQSRPAPRAGGRRGGWLARPSDRCPGDCRQPTGGRGGGPPARRRQGPSQAAAPGSSNPRPPPRGWQRRLADRAGPPRAGPPRGQPSGWPPRRRGALPDLVSLRQP